VARSRVELFEQIRKDRRVEGTSIRELAGRHHVHRRTVRQALDSAVPPPRKVYPQRRRPAIDAYALVIDGWLLADRQVPRKQRHTARRVWQRLVAEHGATLSEVTVSRYVARRKAELGLDRVEVSVPQAHPPGAEAEVDFGEFHAMIAGVLVKLWLFVLRLSCSGRAFHVAFATQAQEAFLEGHVLAFEYFGAVPGRIRYDNLKRPWPGCCGAGTVPRRSGSSRCARITGSTRSSASPARPERTRRAASKARSAGSAAATWCRFRRHRHWPR
jgi:transposase